MEIKISVVIPTYKRPKLLIKCMEALMGQDFPFHEYEIIVVTDGPDEQTSSVIHQMAEERAFHHIICLSLSSKRGPAAARNAGWKTAKGKLVVFTDDDCLPARDWIRNYYNAFLFYGSSLIAFTGKTLVPRPAKPTDFELNTARLETAEFVTANCACSKPTLEYLKGFDEAFTMAWREDSDLEFRLIKARIPIVKIEEAEVTHPVRKAKWGISLKEQKKSMFNALLFKKHPELYKEKIRSYFLWNYLGIAIFIAAFYVAWYNQIKNLSFVFLTAYIILSVLFIWKRLSKTSLSPNHIIEMVITSLIIPFASLFWNIYGAFKYKALPL